MFLEIGIKGGTTIKNLFKHKNLIIHGEPDELDRVYKAIKEQFPKLGASYCKNPKIVVPRTWHCLGMYSIDGRKILHIARYEKRKFKERLIFQIGHLLDDNHEITPQTLALEDDMFREVKCSSKS